MDDYTRFEIVRPVYLSDDHWSCVEREADRLTRSLAADDGSQALSDLKCLVESIARIVLDVDGAPASPNDAFDSVVKKAHELLSGQPGHELANEVVFGQMATQASKIARNLGTIRNEFGGGHGRARTPNLRNEMVTLALDGGRLWTRWALRRLGYFSEGRPLVLIRDLVEAQKTFYAGTLRDRLIAANLPKLPAHHQRSVGVAVGQRAMRGTFVVETDGVQPCLQSDDLTTWPRDYRLGLALGLWFDPDGHLTLTDYSLRTALRIIEPIADASDELTEWVQRIGLQRVRGGLSGNWNADFAAEQFVRQWMDRRPPAEHLALSDLAERIQPEPPF